MRQLKILKSITNRESESLEKYLHDIGQEELISVEEKFDETRGFKFISYAVWWIRQSILQAISEQSRIVRMPLNQIGSANKINRWLNKFEQENERNPSLDEIADCTNMPREKIAEALLANCKQLSVDSPIDRMTATVCSTSCRVTHRQIQTTRC